MSDVHIPTPLSSEHLTRAVVSTQSSPEVQLTLSRDRVDAMLALNDALRVRLDWFTLPARQETLSELVQAARRRLRQDRGRVDIDELNARRSVLHAVIMELTP